MNALVRRLVPYTLLPLSLIACGLASAPWLRAFPSTTIAVPLFGAAVLSVLAPVVVVGIGIRQLWLTAIVDFVLFVFYELLVTLREPVGFVDLYNGLAHGPSQILSFALPLVSPRTLLVAPVALCWLAGAVIGECIARGWQSVLPYLTLMVTFGLSYAGTARAVSSADDGRRYDTLFGAVLLIALLLLRAAQAWVAQDESAEMTQPEGILPLRGLAIGAVVAIAVAATSAAVVRGADFAGRPVAPARVPPLDQSEPLTPVAFVAGLRPKDPRSKGEQLFSVSIDRSSSNYIALASVDYYDGDSWSFNRTFRPSGGVVPADTDPEMRPRGPRVVQQYTIGEGSLTSVPWMPHLDRAERVTGVSVDIDSVSGMIVPSHALHAGDDYTVRSAVARKSFADLARTALLGTSAAQVDTTLANGLSVPLGTLISSLEQETGVSVDQPIPFLQAVMREFRTHDALAGAPATATATPTPSPSISKTPPKSSSAPTPSPTPTSSAHTGGTTFADVLASIRGSHSGTPEQFATLTALIARKLNVPARVVSGFRLPLPSGATSLDEGTYHVTTAQAWTWVEIPVRGMGWVVLDPSPGTYAGQQRPQGATTTPPPTPSPRPSQNAELTHSNNGGHAVAPKSKTPHSKGLSATTLVVIVLAIIAVVVVLLIAFLLARKRVRVRRRRRVSDPRRRLIGAWQESIDVLVESGLPDLTCATSAEVVASTEERFGDDPAAQAHEVGNAANVAIFSPAAVIEPADADAAWSAQARLRKSVRRRLGWRDRVTSGLRYNRRRRTKATIAPNSWAAEAMARAAASKRVGKHAQPRRRLLRR